ncbi:MAG: CoA transferase [Lachnospiraceae bacterium]|nr:CoA transferase [Lachnospiraceae bacterium]
MSNQKILEGIKVVEMGTHVAVPYCSRELSDLGADVIKVEPLTGESYRGKMGMLFQLPFQEDYDVLFNAYNVDKKSLSLNLKDEDAKEALIKLLGTVDVFVTNTREEVLARLGLSFESLQEKYPKLIIGNVSGYGTKGPDKDKRGYDASSFWSPSGMIQEWNFQDNDFAFKPFYGFGDAIAASQLTSGILAALYQRALTGKGDIVRVSLLATGLWTNICGLLRYQDGQDFPRPYNQPIVPLDNFMKTKDGKQFLCSEENWPARYKIWLKLMGREDLMDDPNWNSMKGYVNRADIPNKVDMLKECVANHTSEELDEALKDSGAIYEYLNETDNIMENQQAWENDIFAKVQMRNGKESIITNAPIRFASQPDPDGEHVTARKLGEDGDIILKELGFSDEKIAEMVEKKSIIIKK